MFVIIEDIYPDLESIKIQGKCSFDITNHDKIRKKQKKTKKKSTKCQGSTPGQRKKLSVSDPLAQKVSAVQFFLVDKKAACYVQILFLLCFWPIFFSWQPNVNIFLTTKYKRFKMS